MEGKETLKEALTRVGDVEYIKHLTPETQELTEDHITDFLNSKENECISPEVIKSLRIFAKHRIRDGKSIFPYEKMAMVEQNEADNQDPPLAGFW